MRIRDILFRNFWWKLGSLLLATLIWFTWSDVYMRDLTRWRPGVKTPQIEELPVVVVASAGDVRQFRTEPAIVRVALEGTQSDLKLVDLNSIHARVFVVDPTNAAGQKLPVEISGLPPGVSLFAVKPEKVTMQRSTDSIQTP
jgi:hypothetical protein